MEMLEPQSGIGKQGPIAREHRGLGPDQIIEVGFAKNDVFI